jgi:acyl-CoA thioesterase FadM
MLPVAPPVQFTAELQVAVGPSRLPTASAILVMLCRDQEGRLAAATHAKNVLISRRGAALTVPWCAQLRRLASANVLHVNLGGPSGRIVSLVAPHV